jgi:hypothetical protein
MDSQDALSPTDVIEADSDDLAGAQSVGSNQQEHGVVAQAHRRCGVHRSQKRANGFPR